MVPLCFGLGIEADYAVDVFVERFYATCALCARDADVAVIWFEKYGLLGGVCLAGRCHFEAGSRFGDDHTVQIVAVCDCSGGVGDDRCLDLRLCR